MKLTVVQGGVIPFDERDVLKSLGMPPEHRFAETIRNLLEKAKDIARPKALYLECPVERVTETAVWAGGVTLCSDILAARLRDAEIVYPYVCTCGPELADYAAQLTDMTEKFAFDAIMDVYRRQMKSVVEEKILNLLPEGKVVTVSEPGSLMGWPIQELKKIFALFGDEAAAIGVTLKPNYLMLPLKTVAGVYYGIDEVTTDCVFCRRKVCSLRKEPFNEKAYLETLYRG